MSQKYKNRQEEIDANYQAFLALLPELVKNYKGKFVLMHDQEAVEFFDSARDAMVFGSKTYKDSVFSVQEVTQSAVDLGWFSHAPHYAAV